MITERTGVVKSAEMAEPLGEVTVSCTDEDGVVVGRADSDSDGRWTIHELPRSGTLHFEHEGYITKSYPTHAVPEMVRLLERRLIGYHDWLWCRPGEEVTAYIHAPEPFSATLYRHGLDNTAVMTFPENDPRIQQVPDGIFVETGLDWEPALTYAIPDTAEPGLYSLLLTSGNQPDFAIPLVVSTPPDADVSDRNDLLVLASTNNWLSYNIWGGRNRYRNFEEGLSEPYLWDPSFFSELLARAGSIAPAPLVRSIRKLAGMPPTDPDWKFKKLSIKRPFTNCALEDSDATNPFTNHLAAGEWRVLAWLEREEIPYDITSCYELHRHPEMLEHYKAVLLSTHSEYWSEEMYYALKENHLENGLSIANVSGNSIYREVAFYADGSHRCASLKFGESVEDETRLIGVRFTEGDFGTCAPYNVLEPDHWIFEGLHVRDGQQIGLRSLNRRLPRETDRYDPGKPGVKSGLRGEGASGWETDKLSSTAPADFVTVAKGQNRWGGADMVVREPGGTRGGVFSASSITFGGSLLIEEICSGLMNNVLNRFLSSPPQ
ncbi:MAG: carboxypeptidase-like regulatory domain-containing protein [Balneolaceae bacterium]|nr:carboxypeptidase-like regulatory domain-containing protein [Balneolaceae bacterium]